MKRAGGEQESGPLKRERDPTWPVPSLQMDATFAVRCTDEHGRSFEEDPDAPLRPPFESAVLLLRPGEQHSIIGEARLVVIQGYLDVFGYRFTQESAITTLLAPITSSALVLSAIPAPAAHKTLQFQARIAAFAKRRDMPPESVVVVVLRASISPVHRSVCSLRFFKDTFGTATGPEPTPGHLLRTLQVLSMESPASVPFRVPEAWPKALSEFRQDVRKLQPGSAGSAQRPKGQATKLPTVLFCGGKDVGKSSMARYTLNSTLNDCDAVAFLDGDVGQTEFAPPGCMSLHIIHAPAFSSPFTHLRPPHRAYFVGSTSPKNDPALCLQAFRALMDDLRCAYVVVAAIIRPNI
jgi:polynucleotide 5'-hydroxyl-kinase GRC3/NOL9